jgi:hypothetical protein
MMVEIMRRVLIQNNTYYFGGERSVALCVSKKPTWQSLFLLKKRQPLANGQLHSSPLHMFLRDCGSGSLSRSYDPDEHSSHDLELQNVLIQWREWMKGSEIDISLFC